MVLISVVCQAQTADEWLKQNKTQTKYLMQQIAALQMYIGYVEKGYSITQKGLKTISNIKKGEWHLHADFFGSLNSINPKISKYSKVAAIIALQTKIIHTYTSTYKQIQQSDLFNSHEVEYIYQVFTTLLNSCTTDIDVLAKVMTTNEWKMKDNERLNRIDRLYDSMLDHYAFVQSFSKETRILAIQRMKEKNGIQTSRFLHGLN